MTPDYQVHLLKSLRPVIERNNIFEKPGVLRDLLLNGVITQKSKCDLERYLHNKDMLHVYDIFFAIVSDLHDDWYRLFVEALTAAGFHIVAEMLSIPQMFRQCPAGNRFQRNDCP